MSVIEPLRQHARKLISLIAFFVVCTTVAIIVVPTPVCADSWPMPSRKVYIACDGSARLVVVPAAPDSPLAYFRAKVAGREAAPPAGPQALLEKRTDSGEWVRQWQGRLINEVAPVEAVVAPGGRGFVTFDNWHSTGHGKDAVVVYGAGGKVIRSMALKDFLSRDYVAALSHSVSSIHWRSDVGTSRDGRSVTVAVERAVGQQSDASSSAIPFNIKFVDGTVDRPEGQWRSALAVAKRVNDKERQLVARVRAEHFAPLFGPKGTDESEWHKWMREVFSRTQDDWEEGSAWNTLLRLPTSSDYAASRIAVREALRDPAYRDALMFASPDRANLVRVLEYELAALPVGALSKSRIIIAAGLEERKRLLAPLMRSGAKHVTFIDPAAALPQRKERLTERYLANRFVATADLPDVP